MSGHPNGLKKLSGEIRNYKATRAEASFVFTGADRTKLGVVAIAAGIAGLSGAAIASASSAASVEEAADYLEFDLDDRPVKGWVWRSPFKEGDQVEVAAEWRGDHYETAGIARPDDRIIALYPHCSRGMAKHIRNALKWWLIIATCFSVMMAIFVFSTVSADRYFAVMLTGFHYVVLASYAFFGLMTFSLCRRWTPFVRLAQKIFVTLDLPDPNNVDLVSSSKAKRRQDDPGEYGLFFFRY
ncbi:MULTISPECIES: putative type VI secretion system effector [unclassified Variovorax]|uniref:putative type VI secretion system effector n=1 Tax=unclassified Variovorax TaxID=663243 RepID=UPI001BD1D5C2|nr:MULTISPECIES: putative type VI secretion system effector [unclassified Variovorax]